MSSSVSRPAESPESSDSEEMPTLENITAEMDGLPPNNKNIKGLPGDSDDEGPLEENGWTDILQNGDLRMKVISPSTSDSPIRPQPGNKCLISLHTRLWDPSASSEEDDGAVGETIPLESDEQKAIIIGDCDVHQSIDLMLPLMDEGTTARLVIKPRFAYGPVGNRPTGVPPNATLDIQLTLHKVIDFELASPPPEMPQDNPEEQQQEGDESDANPVVVYESLEERFRLGEEKKRRGNFWYQRGEFSLAIQAYRGAVKYLDVSRAEMKSLDDGKTGENQLVDGIIQERSQTFNNLAAAQLKMQAFDSALRSVESCLLLAPNNVKALFRRAKILAEKGDIDKAIEDLKKASDLDPKSEAIEFELQKLKGKLSKQNQEQRAMYRRMMKCEDGDFQPDKKTQMDAKKAAGSMPKATGSGSKSSHRSSGTGIMAMIGANKGVVGVALVVLVGVVSAMVMRFL